MAGPDTKWLDDAPDADTSWLDEAPDAPAPAPASPQEHPATAEMSDAEKLAAGIGAGFVKVGRNIYDIHASLPHGSPMEAERAKDWKTWNKENEPLMEAPAHSAAGQSITAALDKALGVGGRALKGTGRAIYDALNPAPAESSAMVSREAERATADAAAAKEDKPVTLGTTGRFIGETAATAPIAGAAGAPLRAAVGAGSPFLARLAAAGGAGAAEGATFGGLTSEDPEQRQRNALMGAAVGAPMSIAGEAVNPLIKRLFGKKASSVEAPGEAPIPEITRDAEYLASRGVPLTDGLRDPMSTLNLHELAYTSRGDEIGTIVRARRRAALEEALKLPFEEARPPGFTDKLTGTIHEKYDALHDAWKSAYDGIRGKGEKIYPAIHDGAGGKPLVSTPNRPGVLDEIIDDPKTIWDDATRERARKFLHNQMSGLMDMEGGAKAPGALQAVDIGDMLEVLSQVKQAGREAVAAQEKYMPQILARAEDALEQAIESQAAPETSSALRALNRKYRDFKVIEDAVTRAGDSAAGITPSRLAAAIKKAEPSRSRYAAGSQGWEMRDISRAINNVFNESISPPTGQRIGVLGLGKMAGAKLIPEKIKGPFELMEALKATRGPTSPAEAPITAEAKRAFLLGGAAPAVEDIASRVGEAAGKIPGDAAAALRGEASGLAGMGMPSGGFGFPPASADEPEPTSGTTPAKPQGAAGGSSRSDTVTQPQSAADGQHDEEQGPTPPPHSTDKITDLAKVDPRLLGPYAGPILARMRVGGPMAVTQWDFVQQQIDPAYRAHRAKLIGDDRVSQ